MKKVIIASGPVIVKDNKVLLNISGEDNFWKFCGGKVKEGETLKETAARRAKEEINIGVKTINDTPYIMYVPKPGDEHIDVILVHWFSDYEGEIKPGQDVKKWQWFEIDRLPGNVAPNIEPTLKYFGFM